MSRKRPNAIIKSPLTNRKSLSNRKSAIVHRVRIRKIQAKMEEERLKEEQEEACEEVVADLVIELVKEVGIEEIEGVEIEKVE